MNRNCSTLVSKSIFECYMTSFSWVLNKTMLLKHSYKIFGIYLSIFRHVLYQMKISEFLNLLHLFEDWVNGIQVPQRDFFQVLPEYLHSKSIPEMLQSQHSSSRLLLNTPWYSNLQSLSSYVHYILITKIIFFFMKKSKVSLIFPSFFHAVYTTIFPIIFKSNTHIFLL